MQPRPHERLPGRRLALGDLVLVVREDQVDAAGVDVERRAEVGHAHRRALDVPARPALADRASTTTARPASAPFQSAKSRTSSLAYSSASTRSPTRSLLGVEPRQPAVRRPRGDAEEDRAVVGPVGVPPLEQGLDERRRSRSMCSVARGSTSGRRHPQRVAHPRGTRRGSDRPARRSPSPAAAAPLMILSSMSVMFMTHVTG